MTSHALIRRTQAGFTIVELVVVIVIIGMLAALTMIVYGGSQRRTAEAVLQSDLHNASARLAADVNFNNTYPVTAAAADDGEGLPASDGTVYQYTYTAGTNSYCLSATTTARSDVTPYHISSRDPSPQEGVCSGHSED